MIHTKLKFKNTKACITAALVLGCAVSGAYAQSLALPTMSDNIWYNPNSQLLGINSAMMPYTPGAGSPQYFFASAAYDGTSSYIYVTDPTIGSTKSIASIGTIASVPDLVIGNNNTGVGSYSVTTDFILAVGFINGGGVVEIDYYDVYDDGITLSVSHLSGGLADKKIFATSVPYSDVHLDVVADYYNTSITGLPYCDTFVITWSDYSGANPVVVAALCDLNGQHIGTPVNVGTAIGVGDYGNMPDVAAIVQKIGSNHDYTAWITYVDWNTGELYVTDYDFPAG